MCRAGRWSRRCPAPCRRRCSPPARAQRTPRPRSPALLRCCSRRRADRSCGCRPADAFVDHSISRAGRGAASQVSGRRVHAHAGVAQRGILARQRRRAPAATFVLVRAVAGGRFRRLPPSSGPARWRERLDLVDLEAKVAQVAAAARMGQGVGDEGDRWRRGCLVDTTTATASRARASPEHPAAPDQITYRIAGRLQQHLAFRLLDQFAQAAGRNRLGVATAHRQVRGRRTAPTSTRCRPGRAKRSPGLPASSGTTARDLSGAAKPGAQHQPECRAPAAGRRRRRRFRHAALQSRTHRSSPPSRPPDRR